MNTSIIICVGISALLVGFVLGWACAQYSTRRRQQQTDDAVRAMFQAIAAEQLDKSTDRFLRLADEREKLVKEYLSRHKEAMDTLVKPLSEKLGKFDELYGRVSSDLKHVAETNEKVRLETGNLTKALRQPHVRGRWGEVTLHRVVELTGLVDHVDYIEQPSTTTEDGRLRPDLIINLPNGHRVAVDSKVALDAYLQAIEETDEARSNECLKRHARQIRDHMQQLSQKKYWEQLSPGTEFVIMFVPYDAFLSAAAPHDPSLFEDGMKNRVVIASPSSLIGILRTIEFGWRHAAVEAHAQEISALGKELYRRVNVFLGILMDIYKGLQKAIDAFNSAVASFESRLLPQMKRFEELRVEDDSKVTDLNVVETHLRTPPNADQRRNDS